MSDKLPKHFGRYEVLGHLGQGGMGFVLRGLDPKLNREVAIKVVPAHLRAMPTVAERFHREALALARLSHPNIVRVFDAGEEAGLMYYVMELLRGRGLDTRRPKELADGTVPERPPFVAAEFVKTFAPLADALWVVHRQNLIHRDIKPANIFAGVPERGAVLTDFGLAWLPDQSQLTQTGLIVGTGRYMAPEQVMGDPPGPLCDIYALGATMWEYATGRLPFEQLRGEQLLAARLEAKLPPVERLAPEVPAALAAIVDRAVQLAPADRFQTARELNRALDRWERAGEPPTGPIAVGRGGSGTRQITVPMTAGAAGIGALGLDASQKKTLLVAGMVLAVAAFTGVAGALAIARWREKPAGTEATVPPTAESPAAVAGRAANLPPAFVPPDEPETPATAPVPAERRVVLATPVEKANRVAMASSGTALLVGWVHPPGELAFSLSKDGGRSWDRLPRDRRLASPVDSGFRLSAEGDRFHVAYVGQGDLRRPAHSAASPGREGGPWRPPIYTASIPRDGGSWTEPIRLGTAAKQDLTPELVSAGAEHPAGRLLAAWQNGETGGGIATRWSTDGGEHWWAPQTLGGTDARSHSPAAAVAAESAIVFWQQEPWDNKIATIHYSSTPGPEKRWTPSRLLGGGAQGGDRGFLAAAASGTRVFVQWTEKMWFRTLMLSETADGGERFSAPKTIGTQFSTDRRNAVAASGQRLWSTWEDTLARDNRWSASRDGGHSWQKERPLYTYITDSKAAALAATARGECWIAWADEGGQVSAMRLP